MKTTTKNDSTRATKVADSTKKSPTQAPLVATVTAGASSSPILTLMQHLAKEGETVTIDRADVGFFLKVVHNIDASDVEGDFLDWLRNGGQVSGTFDESYYIDTAIEDAGPGDASRPARLLREYYQWRAARRHLCGQMQQYIAAVEADDARRDQEEAELLAALSQKSTIA